MYKRQVFNEALKRAGINAPLTEALFITEHAGHINACRKELHMKALQFGVDFQTWPAAPALVAQEIGAPGS